MCRLSDCVDKLPEITILGEENSALTHRDLDDGVIFCARGNHGHTLCPAFLNARTARKSQLSSARKLIHAFGSTSTGVALALTLSPLLRLSPGGLLRGGDGLTCDSSRYFAPRSNAKRAPKRGLGRALSAPGTKLTKWIDA